MECLCNHSFLLGPILGFQNSRHTVADVNDPCLYSYNIMYIILDVFSAVTYTQSVLVHV